MQPPPHIQDTSRLVRRRPAGCFLALLLGSTMWMGTILSMPSAPPAAARVHPSVFFSGTGRADTLETDTLETDTLEADTLGTRLVERYLPARQERRRTATLVPHRTPFLRPDLSVYQREVVLDSSRYALTARERIGPYDARPPLTVDLQTYLRARRTAALRENWLVLTAEHQQRRQAQERGGLGMNIAIPGGRQSAFSTIFGRPQVDLRVTGQADINAGFDYRKSDQQANLTGDASRIDPAFKQDLRLGITGTVGDKMQVDVNWDTQSQFDYQNQVKLEYTGYDDEIIQSIEAGNVFLETPSTLIRSGQSLFGIKSAFQLGNLRLTTIASQEEGQSSSLSIEGGAETVTFTLTPTDYDDDRHFVLGYYFRNRWNDALSDPPAVQFADGFERITEIEVWRLQTSASLEEPNVRQVAAVVDLGEEPALLERADAYTAEVLPSNERDQYDGAELDALRDPNVSLDSFLGSRGLTDEDYQSGKFRLLERGRDYTFDDRLGYLSLSQRLQDNQALAIAFRYRAGGRTYQVGEFAEAGGTTGGANAERLVLKLLRPDQMRQPTPAGEFNPAVWYLQLRNIYELRGRSFTPDNFELNINYHPPGQTPQRTLPDLSSGQSLLQLLGLDRLNSEGARRPDDRFDFVNGLTINQSEGLLIFPYLEPFGQHLVDVIEARAGTPAEEERLREQYAFPRLYRQKKQNAQNETSQYDIYRIEGSYRSDVRDFYDLGAVFGLVEGSVRVTSGGTPLQEGIDYEVDYQGGTVTITNNAYLTAGRDLNIEFEQNAAFNLQKKTLLGARADYSFRDRLSLGATVMRLSQQSPIDKFRIGEEPIRNTIWGMDGALNLEPRWLTRAVDALPLIQTRAPSFLALSGEFAQLRPDHMQTNAFERTREALQEEGRDFAPDELRGISYIDDFENFENTFSLKSQLRSWQLSAPPAADGRSPEERARWRGTFAWYQINENIRETLAGKVTNAGDEAVRLIEINEVFPNQDTRGEVDKTLATLDLYFDPQARGPYNYTQDLGTFLNNPRQAWGGMTQALPEGYSDFSLQNVEFVEFVFKPYSERSGGAGDDAFLYVDLGTISEDIIPDDRLNNEDGLSTSSFSASQLSGPFRLPTSLQDGTIDMDGERTEDLGLDGLASYDAGAYPELATEQFQLRDFLDALENSTPPPGLQDRFAVEARKAQRDPSGDDYHYFDADYFEDPVLFPDGVTLQERFTRYHPGHELNSYEAQNTLAQSTSGRGNTRDPESEDLNFNATVDTENSYFEYRVPLDPARLDSLAQPGRTGAGDYVVGEIKDENGNGTGWYQVRIPVRDTARTAVGSIQDFSLIESIRLWTSGHEAPATLRFATLELVGSQWRKSESVSLVVDDRTPPPSVSSDTRLTVSSINNEENSGLYRVPGGAIVSQTRQLRGGFQNTREQALVLRVENLDEGEQRAIYKTNNQGYNLLKYSNLRMFTHLHGRSFKEGDLTVNPEEMRGKVRLFVRLGANQAEDYYEYEQPLTPSRETAGTAQELWLPDVNGVNLRLSALNQLKVARDEEAFPTDSLYWSDVQNVPLDPSPAEFSPGGDARIGIKGTPSLQNITTIVIGVRNPDGSEDVLEEVTLWINELRVSGYDEESGWAAVASADIQLADLGSLRANLQTRTDGFGDLSSTLSERQLADVTNWSVTTDVNANKLLPGRYGWQIPITFQLQSRTSTPRFAPSRGDVRISEILSQIEANDNLSEEEKARQRERALREAQTHSFTRTLTANLRKQGSESLFLRNTLDGLSLSYSHTDSDQRSPSMRFDDAWRWSTALQYRLPTQEPRTLRPLWFLGDLPLIGALGELRLNYVPRTASFTGSTQRSFDQRQARTTRLAPQNALPEPLRQQHMFTHRRSFGLQHSPFQFLDLSFDTNTDQNFNAASADTLYSVVTPKETFRELGRREADVLIDTLSARGTPAFREDQLQLSPTGEVLGSLVSGSSSPRTEQYRQRFTAVLRLPFADSEALNWIDLEDVTYTSDFGWNNGPIGRNTGATVSNETQVRGGITLHPQTFWRKFSFYRWLEEQARGSSETVPPDDAPGDSLGTGPSEPPEEDEDHESLLQNLNPLRLVLRSVLAVTGVRDFTVTYSGTREATSTGVGQRDETGDVAASYSLLDALQGHGASLGYRFGFDRHIGADKRLYDAPVQVTDLFAGGNQLQARTTLELSPSFQINLNWDAQWNSGSNITYRPDGTTSRTSNGSNEASIWAFGASYLDLFTRQLETYAADARAAGPAADTLGDASGDGRVVLTNETVVDDFRRTFLIGAGGTFDERGLLPLPLPGWNVRYTGLSDWPLLRRLTNSIALQHGYSATYTNGYQSNTLGLDDELATFDLGTQTIAYRRPRYRASSLHITERYQPLIGLDVGWKGALQTNVAWNQSNQYLFSLVNKELTERTTNELTLSANYRKRGLDIPFLPLGRLNNQITFSLTLSRAASSEWRYNMQRALEEASADPAAYDPALALGGDNVNAIEEIVRLAITPRIGYQFSNRVAADFLLQYERLDASAGRRTSYTSLNGGFNVRISISN